MAITSNGALFLFVLQRQDLITTTSNKPIQFNSYLFIHWINILLLLLFLLGYAAAFSGRPLLLLLLPCLYCFGDGHLLRLLLQRDQNTIVVVPVPVIICIHITHQFSARLPGRWWWLLFEEFPDARQILRCTEILVPPVARHFPSLCVEHPWTVSSIMGSPQGRDLILPVSLLAQQFIDLVVQVTDPELAQTS